MIDVIDGPRINAALTWTGLVDALYKGHRAGRAAVEDLFLRSDPNALLVRGAWQDGVGVAVKAVTIFPGNPDATPPRPSVQGAMLLFDIATGALAAVIDGPAITAWKTAGDSALGSRLLSRDDAARLVMIGAGAMAEPLIRAHCAVRPSLRHVTIVNRTPARAEAVAVRIADLGVEVALSQDPAAVVPDADIICCATTTVDPVLRGAWLRPGQHVDLVGAFQAHMREADDAVLQRGRLFVDSRDTTLHHIGELKIPLAEGVITEADVLADFYDLAGDAPGRIGADDITVFKNGGGAHLDLMTAAHIRTVLGV